MRTFGRDHRVVSEDFRVGDLTSMLIRRISLLKCLTFLLRVTAPCEVAQNTQKILQDHKLMQGGGVILGTDDLSKEDKLTAVQVCKVNQFPSQSFVVAEMFTGIPGGLVDVKSPFSDFEEVSSGNCDDTPESAFSTVGDLTVVNTHRYLCSIEAHKKSWQSCGRVGLQNIRRGLRTLSLGLTQWMQQNATSVNLDGLRI